MRYRGRLWISHGLSSSCQWGSSVSYKEVKALGGLPPHRTPVPSVVCRPALSLFSGPGVVISGPSFLFSPSFQVGLLGCLAGIWQQGQEGDWVWPQWAGRGHPQPRWR